MASDQTTGWHHLPRPSNCLSVDNCDGSGSSSTNTVMSQALGISHQPPQCLNKSQVEPIRQKKKRRAHCKISCANDKKWPTTKRVPLPHIPGLNRGFLDSKMLPTGKNLYWGLSHFVNVCPNFLCRGCQANTRLIHVRPCNRATLWYVLSVVCARCLAVPFFGLMGRQSEKPI